MHFSIPHTKVNKNGSSSYVSYNIYINGSFHCSLRYKQLYQFHIQLRKNFGANSLHTFPPKKLFPLTQIQLEERRSQLEKYIQIASQDSTIVNSDIFNVFLLSAQQDTFAEYSKGEKWLEIHQLNWQSVKVLTRSGENSQTILSQYAKSVHLKEEFLPYFSLYLVRRFENDFKTVRRLQNFESPYLTLLCENQKLCSDSSRSEDSYFIIVRKSYWDSSFDDDLFEEKVALNIIYLQALHEVEKGYVLANNEIRNALTNLQAKGDKIEYVKLARSLKYYSYIHFETCYCDYPLPKTCVKISAGNQELNLRLIENNEEHSFRVIRIKCWRLTTSNVHCSQNEQFPHIGGKFELSFEYLFNKNILKWITIYSSQATLIGSCLQSMVEEMLLKREGKKFRSDGLTIRYNTTSSHIKTSSCDAKTLSNGINPSKDNNCNSRISSIPIKSHNENVSKSASYSDILSTESTDGYSSKQPRYTSLVENNVFDEIGDDDL